MLRVIHCLLTDSNNMYAIDYICILASDAVTVAHRFKFDSDFIFIKTYNVRNTTAMIQIFQCRSFVISICKADWPHYDRVSSFSPLFTFRLSKQKTLGFQMLFVIQPLKKYLTEHEPETLPPCHDKHVVSCQDAQRPLSKTASLPEGKCILLLYRILLSTV